MPLIGPTSPWSSAPAVATGPHLTYFGGHVVSSVHVIQVLYGSASPATYEPFVQNGGAGSIGAFYSGVTNSTYVDLMSQYSTTGNPQGTPGTNQTIGAGVFVGQVTLTPSAANDPLAGTGVIFDSQIQNELTAQITAHSIPGPALDSQSDIVTLYAIYFPKNVTIKIHNPDGTTDVSGVDFCAYHGTTATPESYYSVLPDFTTGGMSTNCGSTSLTDFQRVTAVSSHEMAEVITDPEVGLAGPSAIAAPVAWYDPNPPSNPNGEVADICNGRDGTITGGDGVVYTVQKIWSNAGSVCTVRPPPPPFHPTGVGQPAVTVGSDGTQLIFWQGAGNHLIEAWWNGNWNGPVDWTAAKGWAATVTSAPSVVIQANGTQLIFWQGPGGHLFEAWYAGGWNGPVDWTAANHWPASVSSAPSVALAPDGTTQLIFWQGAGSHLMEAWWNGSWNGPVDWTAANHWAASVASSPSVTFSGSTQLIFWKGTTGHLLEAWWNGSWNGPVDWTAAKGWGSPLTSAPTAVVQSGGTQLIFWQGAGGHLIEVWWNGSWNGPVDWTAAKGWGSPLTSAPSAALQSDGTQLIFWQGAGGHLIEVWWNGSWNGPADWSA
jgi:hypothetical protein